MVFHLRWMLPLYPPTLPRVDHTENFAGPGLSNAWFALVHKPISIKQAYKIKEAREAIDKEWKKLKDRRTWLYESVREKADVVADAVRKKEKTHFGSLLVLCHQKNAQLAAKIPQLQGTHCLRRQSRERRSKQMGSALRTRHFSISLNGRKSRGCYHTCQE